MSQISPSQFPEQLHIFFYRQLDFSSEPGVANEIFENEPKSWIIFTRFRKNQLFGKKKTNRSAIMIIIVITNFL